MDRHSVDGGTSAPGAARVPYNDWHLVEPSSDRVLTVTVVVPTRDSQHLAASVAGLARQAYPTDLLEVIVVDDRSDPPVRRADLGAADLDVRVIATDGGAFGAGHARNVGAAAATGDVLLFLDADIVPSRGLATAHARWHHSVGDALVIGAIRQVDLGAISGDALRGPRAEELLAQQDWHPVRWSDRFLQRTDALRHRRSDVWAIVVGANVSIRRERFEAIGGFTVFGRRGIEDTEFGYRAYLDGCLLVPEGDAVGWHPRLRHLDSSEAKARTKRLRSELIHDRIALPPIRRGARQRNATVPRVHAEVRVGSASAEETLACIDGLLSGAGADVSIGVHLDEGHPDHVIISEGVVADDRVGIGRHAPAGTPVVVEIADVVPVGAGALEAIAGPVLAGEVGIVRVILEDAVVATVRSVRACRKVLRVAPPPADDDRREELIEQLFGARWVSAVETGFVPAAPSSDVLSRADLKQAAQAEVAAANEAAAQRRIEMLERTNAELQTRVASLRGRRVIRIADRLGRMVRQSRS